jgi:hypothetical protein
MFWQGVLTFQATSVNLISYKSPRKGCRQGIRANLHFCLGQALTFSTLNSKLAGFEFFSEERPFL